MSRRKPWLASLFAAATLASVATAQSAGPGVTDFTDANTANIQSGDIVEALAVPRGMKVEESAAPPTVRLPIYFEHGSANLRPDARALLEKVGSALAASELEPFSFRVEGHTDDTGAETYNANLSNERAAAVKAYLVGRGVAANRLLVVGKGEGHPVAPNDNEDGRRKNRRVEIINLGAKN
jgi:OOP family OmpA-OmpF porin